MEDDPADELDRSSAPLDRRAPDPFRCPVRGVQRIRTVTADRRARPLGVVAGLVALAALVAGIPLLAADPPSLVSFVSYGLVGALLVVRRPRNPIGWLALAIGFGFIGTTTRPDVDVAALVAGTASWQDFLWAWLGSWAGSAGFLLYAALAMVFPTGRLPDGRWRRVYIVALAIGCAAVALPAFAASTLPYSPDGVTQFVVPNRLAVLPILEGEPTVLAQIVFTALPLVALAIAVAGTVVRYRLSEGLVRLQLRWLLAAVAFVIGSVVAGLLGFVAFGAEAGILIWLPALVAYPTVPAAIWVAVTRYRLFEVDRVISRTISWAIVTGVLGAVFVAAVLGLQTLLADVTQGETLAVALSTLVAFALFQPLRRRVQSAVDRRFDRTRINADRTVSAFAERLRGELDLASVTADFRTTAHDAVRPLAAAVWLRGGEARR